MKSTAVMLVSIFLLIAGGCATIPINVVAPSPAATREEYQEQVRLAGKELRSSLFPNFYDTYDETTTTSSKLVLLSSNGYVNTHKLFIPSDETSAGIFYQYSICLTREGLGGRDGYSRCKRRLHLLRGQLVDLKNVTFIGQRNDNLILRANGKRISIDFKWYKERSGRVNAGTAAGKLARLAAIIQQGPPSTSLPPRPVPLPPPPVLTVNHGSGDGSYAEETSVTIMADEAPAGKAFKAWAGSIATITDPSQAATTLKMPTGNTTVTATYIIANTPPPHQLAVYDGQRVALVLGMSQYLHMKILPNAVNDARSIAHALRKRGFDAQEHYNLPLTDMTKAIDNFTLSVQREDVGVVFIASHGFSIEGENFVMPIDFNAKNQAEGRAGAVSVDQMSTKLGGRLGPTIIVVDACRGDELSRRWPGAPHRASGEAISRSFSAPAGLLTNIYFALSTSPGLFASDGIPGQHSPFTQALLEILEQPNLRLDELFTRVRMQVIDNTDDTGNVQVTFTTHSLTTDFVFTSH